MNIDRFYYFRGRCGLASVLSGLGIGSGDEVVIQAFTCVAVPEGIMAAGAIPVYADLAPDSVNVDRRDVERKISKNTKAIVVQHTFGHEGPVSSIMELCKSRGIALIEDCCHVTDFRADQGGVGSHGDAAFYSLEWGKPVPCGVGGFVRTSNAQLRDYLHKGSETLYSVGYLRLFRLELQYLAYKILYRPAFFWRVRDLFRLLARSGAAESNFSLDADFGTSPDFRLRISPFVRWRFERKATRQKEIDEQAAAIAGSYKSMALASGIRHVSDLTNDTGPLVRFPLWVDDKASFLDAARTLNVEVADWYRTPIHPLPAEASTAVHYESGSCPRAEAACNRIVSLPASSMVTKSDLNRTSKLLSGRGS